MLTVVVKNHSILAFLVFAIGGHITHTSVASYGEIVATIEGVQERFMIYDLFTTIPGFLHFALNS